MGGRSRSGSLSCEPEAEAELNAVYLAEDLDGYNHELKHLSNM